MVNSRPLKFRAWDGIRMVTSGIMFSTTDGKVFSAGDMPIMQYTGLHDKNGVEIYEGDIVRRTWDIPTVGVIHFEYGSFVFAYFCDLYDPPYDTDTLETAPLDSEIIGNVYQNPELLLEVK